MLKEHFAHHGEIVDTTVMYDNSTKRSRGFGFVTFKDSSCVERAVCGDHYLDGKKVCIYYYYYYYYYCGIFCIVVD